MGSFYDKISHARNQLPPPVVAKLEGVFEALDDTDLLDALKGKTHRGCQGYSVEALWRSYLVAYVQNIPSVSALIRYLIDQPSVAEACGLIAVGRTSAKGGLMVDEAEGILRSSDRFDILEKAIDGLIARLDGLEDKINNLDTTYEALDFQSGIVEVKANSAALHKLLVEQRWMIVHDQIRRRLEQIGLLASQDQARKM